jgi:hypothetical protein
MPKYKTETSNETIIEAEKLAKANQRPSQSKEQTKIIALGIQKGIEQYKKKNKTKSRELNKKLKTVKSKEDRLTNQTSFQSENHKKSKSPSHRLPWILLTISWGLFFIYLYSNTA